MKPTLLFCISILICSCSDNRTSTKTLSEEEFRAVYMVLLEKNIVRQKPETDTLLTSEAEGVLDSLGITADEFRGTVRSLGQDVEYWGKFFENVANELQERNDMQRLKDSTNLLPIAEPKTDQP